MGFEVIDDSIINTISLYEELKKKIEKDGKVTVTLSEFDVDSMRYIDTDYIFERVELNKENYCIIGYFGDIHIGFTVEDLHSLL